MRIRRRTKLVDACAWLAAVCACSNALMASGVALPPPQTGLASVYSEQLSGKRTASGERYDGSALTAAHMSLPLGSEVRVVNLANAKSVRVRINDRGPHVGGRIIDLSSAAAAALGLRTGVARVKLEVLSRPAGTDADARSRR